MIDLRYQEDLLTWKPYEKNPIISCDEARWPSVLYEEVYFYMAHTIHYSGKSSIILKKSKDGIQILFVSNLIEKIKMKQHGIPFCLESQIQRNFFYFINIGQRDQIEAKLE